MSSEKQYYALADLVQRICRVTAGTRHISQDRIRQLINDGYLKAVNETPHMKRPTWVVSWEDWLEFRENNSNLTQLRRRKKGEKIEQIV